MRAISAVVHADRQSKSSILPQQHPRPHLRRRQHLRPPHPQWQSNSPLVYCFLYPLLTIHYQLTTISMAGFKKKEKAPAKTTGTGSDADIERAISQIKTKFGDESIMMLGAQPKVDVNAIPTGSIGIDWALGIGGLPRGRIIEIFGPESSGKTTLSLHAIAEAQKKGGVCAFIDAEHALDPEYAKKLGVKIEELLVSQPDTGEQALEIVESLVRSGKIDVIVIDSVAARTSD